MMSSLPALLLSSILTLGPLAGAGQSTDTVTGDLDAYVAGRPGAVSVAVTDLSSGKSYEYAPDVRTATASIVKLDILEALLLKAQDEGRPLTYGEDSLATDMIEVSDNDAASALFAEIGGAPGLTAANQRLGLTETTPSTSWGATTTSAADQVRLLTDLVSQTSALDPDCRTYVLDLMGNVTDSQTWGVSAAAQPGDTVELKNGWLPRVPQDDLWTVNSVGRVTGHGHDFLIAVISERSDTMSTGITTIEHVAKTAADSLR